MVVKLFQNRVLSRKLAVTNYLFTRARGVLWVSFYLIATLRSVCDRHTSVPSEKFYHNNISFVADEN
jgi:hypothetical protein